MTPTHGGKRPGAGSKPQAPSGERRYPHSIRWTNAEWGDALLIGVDRVREVVRDEAKRVREGLGPNAELTGRLRSG